MESPALKNKQIAGLGEKKAMSTIVDGLPMKFSRLQFRPIELALGLAVVVALITLIQG